MLEAANWAPTHGKTEPWRFVVLGRAAQEELLDLSLKVRNTKTIASFGLLHSGLECPLSCDIAVAFTSALTGEISLQVLERDCTPEDFAKKRAKIEGKRKSAFSKVSYMIPICMKRRAVAGKEMPEWEEMCAVACAVQVTF